MTRLVKLWRTFETLPNLSATRKEWRLKTGEGYAAIEKLLKPTGRDADLIPCANERLGMHYHEVVERPDGTLEAVYIDEFLECGPFPIEKEDRAIMTVDMSKLCLGLCRILGIECVGAPVSDERGAYHLGDYHPVESYRFPVYLAMRPTIRAAETLLFRLAAEDDKPFLILTPTLQDFGDRARVLITSRNACALTLDDIFDLSDDGSLTVDNLWNHALDEFHDKVLPRPNESRVFFPTPPNTFWEDVVIRFVDGHTVFVTVKEEKRRYTYTEMGMSSAKSGTPTRQWEFLRVLADNDGGIHFDMGDPRRNESWKNELTRNLREFFHMEDGPFIYDKTTGCWQARLTILPE